MTMTMTVMMIKYVRNIMLEAQAMKANTLSSVGRRSKKLDNVAWAIIGGDIRW